MAAESQTEARRHKRVTRVKSSPIDLLVWEYTTSLDQRFSVDELNASGLNALQQCALDGNLQGVKLLVALGADCDKKGRGGWTALHYAASEGYIAIVRYLLSHGANVRIKNNEQKFPVEITEDKGILKLLYRATVASTPLDILHNANSRTSEQHKESI